MLNKKLNPFLIEINSNPCLDSSGIILCKLIHELVENVIMVAIDPLFPEPEYYYRYIFRNSKKRKGLLYKDYFQSNKFTLIYADKIETVDLEKTDRVLDTHT